MTSSRSSAAVSLDSDVLAEAPVHFARGRKAYPAVDDHIVMPGTRAEVLRGKLLFASPSHEPHATAHSKLAYLLEASVASGYLSAVDMLTRTGHKSDFAPDASIFSAARDPATGGRKLEEIAFKIVSTQALSIPTDKARELSRRGVRRIFCILVKRNRVLEWDRSINTWSPVADGSLIEDRCFVRPLPVRALLDSVAADEAVAHALLARGNQVLSQPLQDAEQRGEQRGELQGKAQSIVAVLAARGIAVTEQQRVQIRQCTESATLDRWVARAAVVSQAEAVFRHKD